MTELPSELVERYPLVETRLHIGGRDWYITSVQDQDALMREVRTDADLENFPYGLMLWASAIGFAEWLSERPSLVSGQRVLEIGAGIGLAGLVTAGMGAEVVQTDYQLDALAICQWNAERNMVSHVLPRVGDWRDFPEDLLGFPVVLGTDILYERSLHTTLATLLPRLVAPGGVLILADPIRPQALEFLERQERDRAWTAEFDGRRVLWQGDWKDIAIVTVRFPNR